MSSKPYNGSRVLSQEPLENKDANWIRLNKINWQDPKGRQRVYECAERSTRGEAGIDAVAIIALLENKDTGATEILLEKQYRPPIDAICIEAPAGLVDPKESTFTTAERELYEETGYVGKAFRETPIMWNDPGFTNTNMKLVFVRVDPTLPENINPQQHLDDGEHIDLLRIPVKDLYAELGRLEEQGYSIDGRLVAMAAGLDMQQSIV